MQLRVADIFINAGVYIQTEKELRPTRNSLTDDWLMTPISVTGVKIQSIVFIGLWSVLRLPFVKFL